MKMPRRPIRRGPGRPLRRPFDRRGIRGIPPAQQGGRGVPPVLIAAHRLYESGQYEQAAKTYLDLAEKGIARGLPQAPNLYFQAARCYVMLGKASLAVEIARKAVDYFAKEERWADLYRGVKRSVNFLTDKGYSSEAQLVESWAAAMIPAAVLQNLESTKNERQSHQVTLPTQCPSCGGVVNPKEVEWVDETSVICDFCGSVIRGA